MKYANIPASLEKLSTPVLICDERGSVIYKNTAAVRSVRLPRRHTSMLTHLGQTEQGELRRLAERKKPSVLTVQTGDRNARALVLPYEREGKPCSLWVFISLLQTGSVSGLFAELDGAICAVGREICEYIKAVDEFSLALPAQPSAAQLVRLDKQLGKVIDGLASERRPFLYDLSEALRMLREAIERPLLKYGYQLTFTDEYECNLREGDQVGMRTLVDLQYFFTEYLHLILFSCDASPSKQVELTLVREGEGEDCFVESSFSLQYPPFFTEEGAYSDDYDALIALSPANRFEIRLFEAYSKAHGYQMSYQITHEAERNVHIRIKLPVFTKTRLRSGEESTTELLFVRHDLTLYFWHIVKERLGRDGESL